MSEFYRFRHDILYGIMPPRRLVIDPFRTTTRENCDRDRRRSYLRWLQSRRAYQNSSLARKVSCKRSYMAEEVPLV